MIRNNLFYKLLALGIAITLWAYVNAERNPQARKIITVPIEPRNCARGYATELNKAEVAIELEGPKTTIDSIRREDASAWVDMRKLKTGPDLVSGRVKVDALVAGVAQDEVRMTLVPRYVNAKIEAIRSRQLPVEVKFLSAPPMGYSYSDPEIAPDSVGISGKATQVAQVQSIVLPLNDTITAGVQNKPVVGYFKVVPTDARGKPVAGVSVSAPKVRLKLTAVEVPMTKTVVVSETIIGRPKFPAKVVRVTVSPQSVTLEGKPKLLNAVSTIETDDVSIEGLRDTVTREVDLRIPPGLRAISARKARVTVTITPGE